MFNNREYESINKFLILVGEIYYMARDDKWIATDNVYRVTNVGKINSLWEQLPCKLRLPMASPELLLTNNHLYLLGSDSNTRWVKKIQKNLTDSESGHWEDLNL